MLIFTAISCTWMTVCLTIALLVILQDHIKVHLILSESVKSCANISESDINQVTAYQQLLAHTYILYITIRVIDS